MHTDTKEFVKAVGAPASPVTRGHTHEWLGETLFPGGWHHIKDLTVGDEWWVRICKLCRGKQETMQKPPEARS